MSWDGLIVGARWPCGCPKTPENTLQNGKYQRCLACHRRRARDYHQRISFNEDELEAEEEATATAGNATRLVDSRVDLHAQRTERDRAAGLGGEYLRALKRWERRHLQ